jgi:hypothetical protein
LIGALSSANSCNPFFFLAPINTTKLPASTRLRMCGGISATTQTILYFYFSSLETRAKTLADQAVGIGVQPLPGLLSRIFKSTRCSYNQTRRRSAVRHKSQAQFLTASLGDRRCTLCETAVSAAYPEQDLTSASDVRSGQINQIKDSPPIRRTASELSELIWQIQNLLIQ